MVHLGQSAQMGNPGQDYMLSGRKVLMVANLADYSTAILSESEVW